MIKITVRQIIDKDNLNKKLKIYKLIFNQKKFIEKVNEKQKMWKRDLQDLVIGTLPEFDDVVTELIEWSKTWKK